MGKLMNRFNKICNSLMIVGLLMPQGWVQGTKLSMKNRIRNLLEILRAGRIQDPSYFYHKLLVEIGLEITNSGFWSQGWPLRIGYSSVCVCVWTYAYTHVKITIQERPVVSDGACWGKWEELEDKKRMEETLKFYFNKILISQ